MTCSKYNKNAFTLVEMLVVVVIIGLLAVALVPRFQNVEGRARDATRKTDLQQIAAGLELYKQDNGKYPPPTYYNHAGFCYNVDTTAYPGCNNSSLYGSGRIYGMSPNYFSNIPVDPKNASLAGIGGSILDGPRFKKFYAYSYVGNQRHYTLATRLENTSDSEICSKKGQTVWGADGTGYICNTMSRPNFASNGPPNLDALVLYFLSSN